MLNVTLVNPPNHQADAFDLAPPLGLMVLADVAQAVGWNPQILDLALPVVDGDDPEAFYARSTAVVLGSNPRVVGFASMGVNTHVAIEIARRVKAADPSITTCVGGVHFTSISAEVKCQYPWIDVVILGEGEEQFASLLSHIATGKMASAVPSEDTAIAPIPVHPHRGYELIDLATYFRANPRRLVNYEGGRGCVFKCAFCYSPSHYRAVRDVSADQLVIDWTKLAERGVRHVFMVQDNFVNNPQHAIALCAALEGANLPITWNGYATLPQLNSPVIDALGRSGCRQMYLGVDAVTATQRVAFNKRFYRTEEHLLDRLRALQAAGVEPTCAFMLDLFNFDESEAEGVFRVAAQCAAIGAAIRLNTFTRYPGSSLARRDGQICRYSEGKVRMMFDCPRVVRVNPFARDMPWAFPFHATEVADEDVWLRRLGTVWLAQRLIQAYPDDFVAIGAGSENAVTQGLGRLAGSEEWRALLESSTSAEDVAQAAELY